MIFKKSIYSIGGPLIAKVYWWTTNSKGVLKNCKYKKCIDGLPISFLV